MSRLAYLGRLLAVVLAFAMVASACGGSSDDSSAAPGDDTSGQDASIGSQLDGSGSDTSLGGGDSSHPLPHDGSASDSNADSPATGDDGGGSDLAPVPVLSSIAPGQGVVGTPGPTIACTGSGFVPRTVVQVNGVALATSYVSPTELRATVPNGDMLTVQRLHVTVGTAPPGGGASSELPFDVVNPAPALTQIAPLSAVLGSADTPLTVTGMKFVMGATISFGGSALTTNVQTATTATATIPAAKLTTSGSYDVTITNPTPGGGTSTPISFTVTNPTVNITLVQPSQALVGDPATKITLTGTGFLGASSVSVNGSTIASTYVDAQHLTATIGSSSLLTAGDFPIVVTNPAPGGGVSAPATFHVVYPKPTETNLSPSSAIVASAPPTVVVTGTGFVQGATTIAFSGTSAPTSVIDSSHASATLTTQQLATAGTIAVTVSNPTPGGGTSSPLTFTIANPVPTATNLSPTFATLGSGDTLIIITGTGFVPSSIALAGTTPISTSYGSPTSLNATIPASMLSASGSIGIAVTNPAPGGGTSAPISFTITNPTVTVSDVQPSQALVGDVSTVITVTGTGFVNASTVSFNGSTVSSSYVDAQHLSATIPSSGLLTAGAFPIIVTNPAPGGGVSSPVTFQVVYRTPTATGLSPASVVAASVPPTVVVTGTGFVQGATTIAFNAASATTTVIDGAHASATLTPQLIAAAGTIAVTVSNPTPGGGTTSPLTFTVANPVPTESNLSPTFATIGASATPITVTGTGFVSTSTVVAGATSLTTQYVNAGTLTATIPSGMLSSAGTLSIAVTNPAPGGGTSGSLNFTIDNPGPTITNLNPSSVTVPAGNTQVTITGGSFVSLSQAMLGSSPLTTVYNGATSLTATIPSAQLQTAGTLSISVQNPAPGGGQSGSAFFTANNPAPVLTSLSTAALAFGSPATQITLTGSGFVAGSVVKSGSTVLSSNTQNAGSILATVPTTLLNAVGTLSITVTNPAPGGGVSAPKTIAVNCDSTGADYVLSSIGSVTTITLNMNTAPTASRIIQSLGSNSCPATPDTSIAEPYRAYVVASTLGQSSTLTAWEVCASTSDGFLAFFDSPTIPQDLEACWGSVGEGASGTGAFTSPEANGSSYCAGFTKAKGGFPMPACGRAVVFVQAYSTTLTSYTPPPTLKIELQ